MAPTADLAIATRALRKVYGNKVAVDGLTLEVRRGEVFGFLGPNGAGKSTSIKMLLGLVGATSGEAWVLGELAGHVETRRQLGFLPEHFRFHDWLSAAEFLDFHGRLLGMPPRKRRERAQELLELVGLSSHADKRLRDFSKGMLQRIGLAQALLQNPALIFLDEPTSGLDPIGRRLVRDIIKAQRQRGATVFLNSHLLSEVEITCDRVAFIKNGQVLETREVEEVSEQSITVSMRVQGAAPQVLAGLTRWVSSLRTEGEEMTFTVGSADAIPELLRYLVGSGVAVYEMTPRRPSLEERFLQIVGEDGGL